MLHLQWVEWVLLGVRKDNLAEMYCMGTETATHNQYALLTVVSTQVVYTL